MLKACGRRREVEGVLRVFEVMKTVYESRRKCISPSDAIDDIFDVIFFRYEKRSVFVVQERRKIVDVRSVRSAPGQGDGVNIRVFAFYGERNLFKIFVGQSFFRRIVAGNRDAETKAYVPFVRDENVSRFDDFFYSIFRPPSVAPQFCAVVDVE